MERLLGPALAAVGLFFGVSQATAGLIPTADSFFTPPVDGLLTFTFEGYSAWDTDQMIFAFNGDALFTNKMASIGDVAHEAVVAGQAYRLSLRDSSTGDIWSSDPATNGDGGTHLARTSMFSDFHVGTTAPMPVSTDCALASTCYFGWEDRPGPTADNDFNDLVFALQFTPASTRGGGPGGDPIPEPGTLLLLCASLLGLGFLSRRGA